jgi:hypothetical protein
LRITEVLLRQDEASEMEGSCGRIPLIGRGEEGSNRDEVVLVVVVSCRKREEVAEVCESPFQQKNGLEGVPAKENSAF